MKFELKPIKTSDEELLNDLKRVALSLKKDFISMNEYIKNGGRFHSVTISKRFGGWNNALEKAGLVIKYRTVSEKELLEDLQKVAEKVSPLTVTTSKYNEIGKYHASTIGKRIGWNNALKKAGLLVFSPQIQEKELFKNIEKVWIELGRQPGRRDMLQPLSKYSYSPYSKKFGTWRKALEAFVEYINADIDQNQEREITENKLEFTQEKEAVFKPKPQTDELVYKKENIFKHKTKREPSDRLKLRVLWRDGNKCKLCRIELIGSKNMHFDHIKPWSKGGETELDNLQILCAEHNLIKGNIEL